MPATGIKGSVVYDRNIVQKGSTTVTYSLRITGVRSIYLRYNESLPPAYSPNINSFSLNPGESLEFHVAGVGIDCDVASSVVEQT